MVYARHVCSNALMRQSLPRSSAGRRGIRSLAALVSHTAKTHTAKEQLIPTVGLVRLYMHVDSPMYLMYGLMQYSMASTWYLPTFPMHLINTDGPLQFETKFAAHPASLSASSASLKPLQAGIHARTVVYARHVCSNALMRQSLPRRLFRIARHRSLAALVSHTVKTHTARSN